MPCFEGQDLPRGSGSWLGIDSGRITGHSWPEAVKLAGNAIAPPCAADGRQTTSQRSISPAITRNIGWGLSVAELIDKSGKFVIAPRFDEIAYDNPEPFDKGVAKVKTYDGWGCITRTGEGIECPTQ
jgi:hypothetical protein